MDGLDRRSRPLSTPAWIRVGWAAALLVAIAVRLWNGLTGPLLRGYDDHGHVGYVLYLDLYRAVPWPDQGWSYFHPPLHYLLGWALAQLRDVDVLLHGLALVAGASSLAIAYLASRVVRLADPSRADLPLFAFASVALLPVYLYSSTMAGNEVTAAFFGTLALALFLSNESRERPGLGRDAVVGVVFGLALLSKVSAAIALAACGLALAARLLRERSATSLLRVALRGVVLAGIACAVASPYYARNVAAFGTPFMMSRDNPHVARLESTQPPGSRTWVDFVALPPKLLVDPDPEAEHLLHSVWGTAYAGMWADTRNAEPSHELEIRAARSACVILGLAPTLLALLGGALALRDLARGRRAAIYAPTLCIAATSLGAFAYFALAAPQFSALKASYLFGLTLPYAVFLARGIESLDPIGAARAAALGAAIVGVPGVASALVNASGVVLPPLEDHKAVASIRVYFGRLEAARDFHLHEGKSLFAPRLPRMDNLGAIALLLGDPHTARQQYSLVPPRRKRDPFRWNALAVATALTGDCEEALALLDDAIEAGAGEVGLVNRGVLRTALGRYDDAEADLRDALERDPALPPAWHALAELLARTGRSDEASDARRRAVDAAGLAPRGYPYGVPDGLGQYPSWALGFRFMLRLDGDALRVATAPFRAGDAIAMRDPAELFADTPHLVLLVVDTLRADHLGAYGYERPTSPVIDRLAREGVRFSNASATSSWTLPSVASLFTSLPPSKHRAVAWGRKLRRSDTTFVERLRAAGYTTVGVSGNFVHVNEKVGFDRGFDAWETLSVSVVDGKESLFTGREGDLRAPSAREVNAAVLELLPPPSARPLFLYVHYMEPHSDYDPPPDERAVFAREVPEGEVVTSARLAELVRGAALAAGERARMIDLYDAEIAAVDAAIGELLEALVDRGFGDKLVVAVVSDHGEEFGEHGGWFHGIDLYRESLSVPLVIWDSRAAGPGRTIDAPVDLLDVATTLLSVADVPRTRGMRGRALLPDGPLLGREIVASLARDRILEEHLVPRTHRIAVTRWPWKVIASREGDAEVYRLDADPTERLPLLPADPGVPEEIAAEAARLVAPPPAAKRGERRGGRRSAEAPQTEEPTPDERARLRALGYSD